MSTANVPAINAFLARLGVAPVEGSKSTASGAPSVPSATTPTVDPGLRVQAMEKLAQLLIAQRHWPEKAAQVFGPSAGADADAALADMQRSALAIELALIKICFPEYQTDLDWIRCLLPIFTDHAESRKNRKPDAA